MIIGFSKDFGLLVRY